MYTRTYILDFHQKPLPNGLPIFKKYLKTPGKRIDSWLIKAKKNSLFLAFLILN